MKQGCLLSPVLFNIFVNCIVNDLKQINCGVPVLDTKVDLLMYADDIVLFAENENSLQKMLDCVTTWTEKWRISLNESKTQVVHFRTKSREKTKVQFKCCNSDIDTVEGYKYLGIWFDEFLDFHVSTSNLAASASRALGLVISKAKALGGMNFNTFTKLYDSFVSPILDYGSGVWGVNEFSSINAVFYRACRFFLGVGKYAPNDAMLGDVGWDPPFVRQMQSVARLWSRLSKLDDNRYPKKVFLWSQHLANNGIKNWYYKVKNICSKLKCELVLNLADQICTRSLVNHVKDGAKLFVENRWKEAIFNDRRKNQNARNKLRTYRTFKNTYGTAQYVNTCMKKCNRRALALFRSGCAPIAIETGRYNNTPVDNRVCSMCDMNCVEDEFHCFMICVIYNDFRSKLFDCMSEFDPSFNDLTSVDKFNVLMSDGNHCYRVAKFANQILSLRQSIMYNT